MIHVEHLYKLWGPNVQMGVKLLQQGRSKESLLAEHQLVVGLNDVNLEIARGELFVVMGLSGSGKSTLIRTLNRLVEPTAGRILLDDQDITAMSAATLRQVRARRLGMVFQHFALLPHRTVLENVVFGLEVQGVSPAKRNEAGHEALALVGLDGWEDYLPEQLSGGMQQRVGLARALATNSDVLLMDEAFSALDPLIRKQMQRELLRLQKKLHKTIVFITHDLDEALAIGDRIAVLRHGQLVQVGTPQDIVLNPADDHVATFVQGVNLLNVLTAGRICIPLADLEIPSAHNGNGHCYIEAGPSEVLVLDNDHKPLGVVDEQTLRAVGQEHVAPMLRPVFTVNENILLSDLLRAGHGAFPAVVVGPNGRTQGVIRARAIVNAFSEWEEHTTAIVQEHQEV
jgi:glycine betaine/proline transport system ATP-binding protein